MSKSRSVKHKKPTGELGSLRVGSGSAIYSTHKQPELKNEIEKRVLDLALCAARSKGDDLYNLTNPPIQNPENDFDFTLLTQNGTEYLDLMEVALFQGKGRYEDTPTSYNIGKMVQKVLEGIQKKSKQYGRPSSPVHLLLYSTDWRFYLRSNVLDLLASRVARHKHVFSSIKYVYPDSQGGSVLEHVFPRSADSFSTYDENTAARTLVVFGDIRKAQVQLDGTAIIPMQNPLS